MLAQKKCIPCDSSSQALDPDKAQAMLAELPGWHFAKGGKAIERRFTFADFVTALAFVQKIGDIAEKEGHHPDISLGWGYAECLLWTHAIGGLHDNDFIVAAKINALSAAQ